MADVKKELVDDWLTVFVRNLIVDLQDHSIAGGR